MSVYRTRDQRIADTFNDDSGLSCGASGCPNRWSVDAGNGRLCTAHAWSESHEWPVITEQQKHNEASRAIRAQRPKPVVRVDVKEAIRKLRAFRLGHADPKHWAKVLRERDQNGEVLSEFQRGAWGEAIGQGAQA